jgi:hypothetical protein
MIIIILFLLILFFLFNYYESFIFNFDNNNIKIGNYDNNNIYFPSDKHTNSIYKNRINLIPITINNKNFDNQLNNDNLKSNKCCLVKKELDNDNFKYTYTKYYDNECNINNYVLNHNNQLLFDGINNWNNDECKNDTKKLGSCKHFNFECIDFIDEETCNNYNNKIPTDPLNRNIGLIWSNKPCYNR